MKTNDRVVHRGEEDVELKNHIKGLAKTEERRVIGGKQIGDKDRFKGYARLFYF